MEKFRIAYQLTSAFEGIYSNDPDDRGKETVRGISRKVWPAWEGWKLVDAIKKQHPQTFVYELAINAGLTALVEQFYYENYWLRLSCDDFDQEIANELFDTGVNMGGLMAATYFQQALNKLNRNQKDYPDMITDGQIGYLTKNAYRQYMSTSRFASRNHKQLINWLLKWMNYYQLRKYDLITEHDHAQEKYVPGWTERT
ncbi:MAG: glycosyl hydrolase 108 family protein [Bacteroidales bacterium]|nr:glycosyl hydrolase 108 family protein [Bacteroidales bacterium]